MSLFRKLVKKIQFLNLLLRVSHLYTRSHIGPLLILLYVNDLPNTSNLFYLILFTDDTTIIFKCNNVGAVTTLCNSELGNIFNWTTCIRLYLNCNKTWQYVIRAWSL